MAKVKEERNIVIYVNITYKKSNKKLIQTFSFSTKRKQDLSYLFDARFLIFNEVNKIVENNLLDGFLKRVDFEDKIEMVYDNIDHPAPCIKVINAYIPPYLGCLYCSKAEIENNFIYCPEKNKHYVSPGIKRCQVFRTKPKLLT